MGRAAAGVRGMKLRAGDEVVSCDVARDDVSILIVTEAGYGKRTQLDRFNRQGRGGQGVIGIQLTARKGHVVAAFMVGLDDEIVAVSSGGVTIRMPVREHLVAGPRRHRRADHEPRPGQIVAAAAPILANGDERLTHRRLLPLPPATDRAGFGGGHGAGASTWRTRSGGPAADRSGGHRAGVADGAHTGRGRCGERREGPDCGRRRRLGRRRRGDAAASASAADNGGRLVRFATMGEEVVVTVSVGGASATARATLTVERWAHDPFSRRWSATLASWRSRTGPPARRSRCTDEPFVTGGHTMVAHAPRRTSLVASSPGSFRRLQPQPHARRRSRRDARLPPGAGRAARTARTVHDAPERPAEPSGHHLAQPRHHRPHGRHHRSERCRDEWSAARVAPSPPAPGRARPPVRLRMARRPRVRKVTRVVRRIDAWGVFKITLVFYVILFVILLVAGMLLWNLAVTTGTITNVEGFIKDLFGLKTFKFDGDQLLRSAWVIGGVLVIGGTGLNVTLTVLFNLISDLFGGIRVTVLEEEVMVRPEPPVTGQAPSANGQQPAPAPVTRSR